MYFIFPLIKQARNFWCLLDDRTNLCIRLLDWVLLFDMNDSLIVGVFVLNLHQFPLQRDENIGKTVLDKNSRWPRSNPVTKCRSVCQVNKLEKISEEVL